MTREEAVKILNKYDLNFCDIDGNPIPPQDLAEAFDMAIKALQQEPEWISVTEELPTLNDDGLSDMVLLCWSDGQRTVGAYRGNRAFVGQAWPVAKDVRVTVTAWMPLPEPYEEESEQLESDGE